MKHATHLEYNYMATSTIKGTTRDQIENEKWIACEFKHNTYTYSVGSENFESDASFKMFKDINMNISSLWLDRKNYSLSFFELSGSLFALICSYEGDFVQAV